MIICVDTKKVFRDDFEKALKEYIKAYGDELAFDEHLQDAFIRKFNALSE